MEGQELRDAKKLWEQVAANESRMHLMVELMKHKVGLADVEEFCIDLGDKCRAEARQIGKVEWRVVKATMESKLVDARREEKKLKRDQNLTRKKIYNGSGEDSRKSKKIIRILKNEARNMKREMQKKYKKKVEHLRRKYRQTEEDKIDEIPAGMEELENLSIFDRNKFESVEIDEIEIMILGDADLTENEKLVLRMHPKFSVVQKLPKDALDFDKELAFTKVRMTLNKENNEKVEGEEEIEITEEEQERYDELDAQSRQIFDPVKKIFDDRKRRVTDLKECNRITLPKPMKEIDEALIEIRRDVMGKIFGEHRDANCTKDLQKNNLSQAEAEGLESLQKKIQKKEVIIVKTDKSGKFCAVSQEEYRKMGAVHTEKDKLISMKDVIEIEKQLNGHCTFWCKMYGSGDAHGHRDRIIDSKKCRSCKVASMYIMVKDHKKDGSTRPVVTGCSSNTVGMSNAVSDFLEAIANSIPDAYEVISSEDMLARCADANEKAREIIEEGREKKLKKLRCVREGESCIDKVRRCRKNHADESGEGGGETEMHPQQPSEERSLEMLVEAGMRCTECSDMIEKSLKMDCADCGVEWVAEDYEISILGNDVKALFPNIQSVSTGKTVREEVERSPLEIEGFDYKLGLRYIAMNKKYTGNLKPIAHLLPWKKTSQGVTAGMKSKFVNSKKDLEEMQWNFPKAQPNRKEKRMIVARVAEIGTRVVFENFSYQFGEDIFVQSSGGPIGARVTMAAARIVMQAWSRRYKSILLKSGLRLTLLAGYVDDGRQSGTTLRKGMRFVKEKDAFVYDKKWKDEDDALGEESNVRMSRVCRDAMNSVCEDLQFTTEAPEDFVQARLPTLDFKLWLVSGMIMHTYFEKEMRTPFVVMRRSAMGEQQRMAILSNELIRRLSNVGKEVVKDEIHGIIEHYIYQLKMSEYERGQAREIICSGVIGWKRKIQRREREMQGFYRHGRATLKSRNKKKLLEKTSWYKQKRKRDDDDEDDEMSLPTRKMRCTGKMKARSAGVSAGAVKVPDIKAVMFVPYTVGSKLAKSLREAEEKLGGLTGYRLKMVEKAGDKLEDLLTKSNPWQGLDCGRHNCILCETKLKTDKNMSQDCHTRNLVYSTWCMTCLKKDEEDAERRGNGDACLVRKLKGKIRKHLYIGESSRSMYERGLEHLGDVEALKPSSHMLRHMLEMHKGEERSEIEFGCRVMKFTRSSCSRQVLESVLIQNHRDHNILNSRSEFNRCAIPRLVTKLGDKELKTWREEDKEREKMEEKLEEEIRMLKKCRNRDRAGHQRKNPKSKRQKLDGDVPEETDDVVRAIEMHEGEKRKISEQEEAGMTKKKLKRSDIRYFGCTIQPGTAREPAIVTTDSDAVQQSDDGEWAAKGDAVQHDAGVSRCAVQPDPDAEKHDDDVRVSRGANIEHVSENAAGSYEDVEHVSETVARDDADVEPVGGTVARDDADDDVRVSRGANIEHVSDTAARGYVDVEHVSETVARDDADVEPVDGTVARDDADVEHNTINIASGSTTTITQSGAIHPAVARYNEFRSNIINVPILTQHNSGLCQADSAEEDRVSQGDAMGTEDGEDARMKPEDARDARGSTADARVTSNVSGPGDVARVSMGQAKTNGAGRNDASDASDVSVRLGDVAMGTAGGEDARMMPEDARDARGSMVDARVSSSVSVGLGDVARMRRCWEEIQYHKRCLKEHGVRWMHLTDVEKRRLGREEKSLRQEVLQKRKKKFGKASGKKLSTLEDRMVKIQNEMQSELAEVEQNLEREQMRRQGKKMQKLEGKMLVDERESVEGHWGRMINCRGEILTRMRWVTSEMLEFASLDDQRRWVKEWEPDGVGKDVGRGAWDFWRSMARDAAQHGGEVQHGHGQDADECEDGVGKDVGRGAWNFWRSMARDAAQHVDGVQRGHGQDADECEDDGQVLGFKVRRQEVQVEAVRDVLSLENIVKIVTPTDNQLCLESNDTASTKCKRDQHQDQKQENPRRKKKKNVGDQTPSKMMMGKSEMRARARPGERKDVARPTDAILRLERSPWEGGRVVKKTRCTPGKINKISKVSTLKLFFETENTSPLTRGPVELLQQPSQQIRQINFGLTTTTTQDAVNCVSQSGGPIRTGPRKPDLRDDSLSQDWPRQASVEEGGPMGDALTRAGGED